MGIQGLQSFVEIQCSSEAWQDVDFKDTSQARSTTPNLPSVLVVDAMSCLKHFYGPNTDWVCGGQWNELLRNVENFVNAFRQINIELVVFFNGEQDSTKIQSWIQEEEENRQMVHQILSHVHTNSTFPPKRHYFAPKSVSTCLRLAFRCRDVLVCSTVEDLHKEIISYCKKHCCSGVLGYHSDYLLLDCMCYFSSSHLKLVKKTNATTVKFNTDVIFRELELDKDRLALFSSLLGNSFIPEEWLAQFHWSLLGPDHPLAKLQAQVGKQFILPPYDVVVRSVAKYVRDLPDPSDLEAIMEQVFRSLETTKEDFLQRLQRSTSHYRRNDEPSEVIENGEADVQNEYPIVSGVSRVDVLSSPSIGTSESKYQKRWQHWQQHQYLSTPLLQTPNKVANGISPSSSETDVEKLADNVQQLQLKELDINTTEPRDLLSPTRTLSAPTTPSTPTQQAFVLGGSPDSLEATKTFDDAVDPPAFTANTSQTPAFPENTSQTPAFTENTSQTPAFPENTSQTPAFTANTSQTPVFPANTSPTPAFPANTSQTPVFTANTSPTPAFPANTSQTPVFTANTSQTPVFPANTSPTPAFPANTSQTPVFTANTSQTPAFPENTSQTPAFTANTSPTPAFTANTSPTPAFRENTSQTTAFTANTSPTPAFRENTSQTTAFTANTSPTPAFPENTSPTPALPANTSPTPALPANTSPTPTFPANTSPTPTFPENTSPTPAFPANTSQTQDPPDVLDLSAPAVTPSPTPSSDSEPTPPIPPSQLSPLRRADTPPITSDDKSNEKPLSAFYAFISSEVLKTAKKRHQSGQMIEMVYQILSKGEIQIGAALEDENVKGRPPTALLYRSIRQRVYGILLDKKLYDSAGAEQPRTPPPSIREWCIYGGKKLEKPDMVEPVSLNWEVPSCKQLWLGTQPSDNSNRLKAFLSCMQSDSPGMTKTTMVPQRCVVLCCVLRYLIQKQAGHPILRAQELEAFLAQALSPHLTTECNVTNLSQIKVNRIDIRGVQLATIFMRGVECAMFSNDACGSPIPWDLVCPWNYFDGKLFQSKLNLATSESVTLLELCDGNNSRMEKLERMKWCIMEGLGQDFMLNGLPSNRNPSGAGLLPTPFFGPIPAHLRNAPPLNAHFTPAGASAYAYQQKSNRRGSRRPVSGLGGTLQVAGVPIAKFQGNRAGRGYNPNQQVVVGGRSSVDIGEPKSSFRGRGTRMTTTGRGVSWAPDVDKDFDRIAMYRPGPTTPSTNLSQVHDVMDGNGSPRQPRRGKKRGNKPNEQPVGMNIPGDMTPLMPPRVPMQDPNQMYAKMPGHFGTMQPRGRGMMMEGPGSNMTPANLSQGKNHMVNSPMMGGVNPVHKYGMIPGMGIPNTGLHEKAMMGRGWWWERMKQPHP